MHRNTSRVSFLVKALVALHIVAITVWSLPHAPGRAKPPTNPVERASDAVLSANERYLKPTPIRQYVLATGFWQYWDMFAPNPSSTDLYGTAEIEFRGGATLDYTFPRMAEMSLSQRYVNERYRKFYERAQLKEFDYLWPDFARRVAEKNAFDPSNPPMRVRLIRNWLHVAPPGEAQPTTYASQVYYDEPLAEPRR